MSKIRNLSLAFIILCIFTFSAATNAQHSTGLALVVGQSRILPFEQVSRVAVGDEQIADVLVLTSRELLVNAKNVGITSLHVWTAKGQEHYQIRVYSDDGTLLEELSKHIGIAQVNVSFVGESIVLEGMVDSLEAKERAQSLAEAYSRSVINLIETSPRPTEDRQLSEEIAPFLPAGISVMVINDVVVVEGIVEDVATRVKGYEIARSFGRDVIDLIQVRELPPPEEPEDTPLVEQVQSLLDPAITVRHIGNSLFLEGEVATAYQKERARAVAQAFSVPVVDLLVVQQADLETPEVEPDEDRGPHIAEQKEIYVELLVDSGITVDTLHDYFVLEGQVEEAWQKERALRLSQAFSFPVIDLVQVITSPVAEIAPEPKKALDPQEISDVMGIPGLKVYVLGERLFVEGMVDSEFQKERILAIANAFTPSVIDLVKIAVVQKVEPVMAMEETVEVRSFRFEQQLIADLTKALREPGVSVHFYQETLVLEGFVDSSEAKERIETIAGLFYQPTMSLVRVDVPSAPTLGEQLQSQLGLDTVFVSQVNSNVILEGSVPDQAAHSRVMELARLYGNVIDLLDVERSAQVLLKVQVLEIERRVGEELGINWGSVIEGVFTHNVTRFREVGDFGMARYSPLIAQVNALIDNDKGRLLAAPSILTLSGDTAEFLVGGEIPIIVITPQGPTIEWKEYGVKLKMSPQVFGDQIAVELMSEVSNLDWNNALRYNDEEIPALRTRRASTTVRVTEGSTVVLGGLIQHEELTQVRKLPILGDLPILGALFRSTKYQDRQTELIILVTPQIVYQEGVNSFED